jgi:type II secretory pathway component PulF
MLLCLFSFGRSQLKELHGVKQHHEQLQVELFVRTSDSLASSSISLTSSVEVATGAFPNLCARRASASASVSIVVQCNA